MNKRKFWPLDFDLEGEIYENPSLGFAWHRPPGPNRILAPRVRADYTS